MTTKHHHRDPTRAPGAIALLALTLALGCSNDDDDRAPPIDPCGGTECPPPGGVIGSQGGGEGGVGGASGGGEGDAVDVSGTVVSLSDSTFSTTTPYTDLASVFAAGSDSRSVSAVYSGSAFSLSGVASGQNVWFAVRPDDTATFVDTLSAATTGAGTADLALPVMERATLEEMYVPLLGVVLDDAAAQIVLRISSTGGVPVSGVTVSAAGVSVVAYFATDVWSDAEPATDASGLALLGNVAASSFPGQALTIQLGGAASGRLEVQAASGAATFADVQLSP